MGTNLKYFIPPELVIETDALEFVEIFVYDEGAAANETKEKSGIMTPESIHITNRSDTAFFRSDFLVVVFIMVCILLLSSGYNDLSGFNDKGNGVPIGVICFYL